MTGRSAAPARPAPAPASTAPTSADPASTNAQNPASSPRQPDAPAPEPGPTPPTASAAAKSSTPPAPTTSDAFIPDDVDFGREELPADFWSHAQEDDAGTFGSTPGSEPAEVAARAAPPAPTATRAPARTEPVGRAPTAPEPSAAPPPGGEEEPTTELEAAFNELQSLFPGRVVEVRPYANEDEAGGNATLDDALPTLDDDLAAGDGYDDDDQDRLPFGPGST